MNITYESNGKLYSVGESKLEEFLKVHPDAKKKAGDGFGDGGKEIYIKKIFKGFKDMAYYQMLEKYPKTRERIEAAQIEKYGFYNRKKGDETEEINVLLPQ